MEKYYFLLVFVLLIPVFFLLLRKIKLERIFPQGAVLEIRISYVLLSIILAEITTQAIERIFSLA